MDIKQIEMMLNLISTNRITELRDYLLNERKKYYYNLQREEYNKLAYAAFLKYMCDFSTNPLYSHIGEKTIINDDFSIFTINSKFELGKDKCDVNNSLKSLKRVKDMIENIGLVDLKYKELSYYILKRGELTYQFKTDYIEYLASFVGKDATIYVDTKNPIALAESENGTGYILGKKL